MQKPSMPVLERHTPEEKGDPLSSKVVFKDQAEFVCFLSPDLLITDVSASFLQYFNAISADILGKPFVRLLARRHQEPVEQSMRSMAREYPLLTFELNDNISPIGARWQQWVVYASFSTPSSVAYYHVFGRDISNRKLSEVDLVESERQYRSVVEDQIEIVCRYKPDFTITFVNDSYCRLHGIDRQEAVGKRFLHNLDEEGQRSIYRFIETASLSQPAETVVQRITKENGETLWVEWQRRALFDESGVLREMQGVGRDITEFKQAELALKTSELALLEKNKELERKNTALTEVLEHIEHQKQQIKDDVTVNVEELLIPILDKLKSKGSMIDSTYFDLLKRSLENLTSSFGRKITTKSLKLTPKEIQICNLIKRGLPSKEISRLLDISLFTVGRHRNNIRNKLKITNKRINLNTYLKSL